MWVCVEVFQGVVGDVHLFATEEEADKWFKEYTGYSYKKFYVDGQASDDDYDQTKIFELELPALITAKEWRTFSSDDLLKSVEVGISVLKDQLKGEAFDLPSTVGRILQLLDISAVFQEMAMGIIEGRLPGQKFSAETCPSLVKRLGVKK